MTCPECTYSPMTLSRTSKPTHGLYTIKHYSCPICGHEESKYGGNQAERQYDYKLNNDGK